MNIQPSRLHASSVDPFQATFTDVLMVCLQIRPRRDQMFTTPRPLIAHKKAQTRQDRLAYSTVLDTFHMAHTRETLR